MLTPQEILQQLKEEKVAFLRLWFTDVMGQNKNVEVPTSQFEKALDSQILFDGSSINGFARIEESDMLLAPDCSTLQIFPWNQDNGKTARLICDVKKSDGTDFTGCPRTILKKVCAKASNLNLTMNVGPEAEFFLFERQADGQATTITHDKGGYFDITPIDLGEAARRQIIMVLQQLGFEVEAGHHEVAHGQHEIDFKYADALTTADNISTFRFVVRKIALDLNLHATFMPKPIHGINGSGMHVHQSLFTDTGVNVFYDPDTDSQLSTICMQYMAGLLKHAKGICAITNPLVNSYKRLVPGHEAPTHIGWSESNRSPLIRIPDCRKDGTRIELRNPDPACNPYLALAVMLAAGLEGITQQLEAVKPINRNLYHMTDQERQERNIESLPRDLNEAINHMEQDELIREVLGKHLFHHYIAAKRKEWDSYISQVHQWELDHYLTKY